MKFAQVLFLFVVVNEKKKQREKEQHRKGGENRTMGHVTNRRKNMVKEEHGEEGVRFRFRVRSVGRYKENKSRQYSAITNIRTCTLSEEEGGEWRT